MAWKIEQRADGWHVLRPDGAEDDAHHCKAAAEAHLAIAAKGASFNDIRRRLEAWLMETYPPQKFDGECIAGYSYVCDVWADKFIFSRQEKSGLGKNYQAAYALVGADLTVGDPVEVRQDWEEVKSADTLVFQGGAVKALGGGKVGGYLVTFGDAEHPDSSGLKDFFTAQTDYGVEFPATSPVLYHHGQDDAIKLRRLGKGSLKADEVGVWIEAQLNMRDDYEKAVYTLAEQKKLGWSSGTASHLVERKAVVREGKTIAHEVTAWPLGLDASLTPTPAEPQCHAMALKSLHVESLTELAAEADIQISGETSETKTLAEHAHAVETACEGYAQRLESRLEARAKSGRMLSSANVTELEAVMSAMDDVSARMQKLMEKAKPKQDTQPDAAAKAATEQLRSDTLRLTHRLRSIPA